MFKWFQQRRTQKVVADDFSAAREFLDRGHRIFDSYNQVGREAIGRQIYLIGRGVAEQTGIPVSSALRADHMPPELLHEWTNRLTEVLKRAVNLSHSQSEVAVGIGNATGHASTLMFTLYRHKLLSIEGPVEFRGGAKEYVREAIGLIEKFVGVPLVAEGGQ